MDNNDQICIFWKENKNMEVIHKDGEKLIIPLGQEMKYSCFLADGLGWKACSQCNQTDGSIDCKHHKVFSMQFAALNYIAIKTAKNHGKTEWFDNCQIFEQLSHKFIVQTSDKSENRCYVVYYLSMGPKYEHTGTVECVFLTEKEAQEYVKDTGEKDRYRIKESILYANLRK